ncbi:MAG TPA: asparagine synthase (glutamine-hydrolyzing) [Thermoanaerobaculia bacterium]|jgi:asparagine synthase (glutamine-hydrolysing)|nr:asparagine synthase (glutamine-hydrolyzing) [Thermoanaerobaculia bacterium]
MCGIHGLFRFSPDAPALDPAELDRTSAALARRGPDGEGRWISPDGRVVLGHRRLAILDLSAAGAQPMASADGHCRLVLNGEIYNFRQLREELEYHGERFGSQSDTEVILALWRRDRERMLPKLRGMFTLALWDGSTGELLLARDPFGIKPLYLSIERGTLRFASQVKALEAGGGVSREVEPAAVAGFLLWGSVPEPWTIRRGVMALPAGSYQIAREGDPGGPIPFAATDVSESGPTADPAELLADSIRAHLVSDVPVAVFLSAGLDSGLLAALAAREAKAAGAPPPRAFTLSFDRLEGTPLDEAPLAGEVARTLGLPHTLSRIGRGDFLDLWDTALGAMDQPSIDGFNTFVVARAAREAGIKVALSGLGGDELFGSYPSFRDVPRLALAAPFARWVPQELLAAFARRRGRPKLAALGRTGSGLAGAYALYRGLFLPEELDGILGARAAAEALAAYDQKADGARALADWNPVKSNSWTAVHRLETRLYMRNQLLRDSDWASMAHSLELRVPLVDPRLEAGFAARGFEPAKSRGKSSLVRSVAPELPAALFEREKSGFYMPVMEWLEPERSGEARNHGDQSRRLALRVLAAFGVEVAL